VTRAQADALANELGLPVYVGMRNWRPFIAEAMEQAAAAGVTRLVAIPLAPQYSSLSVAKYGDAVSAAGRAGLEVRFVESWHDHPLLLDAFAEKLRTARAQGDWDVVVFTAHSLPSRVVAAGDPYPQQVRATASRVAERVGLKDPCVAYQSAGRTDEAWLGPSLEATLGEMAAAHARSALVAPIGFVSDHTEILYDIDVAAAAAAAALGITLGRTESLNASPTFVRALADLARTRLG
jgi:ferrochelatase